MADMKIAFKQILDYFSDTTHHKDADTQHVSRDELLGTRSGMPAEAMDAATLVFQNPELYSEMTAVQSEGIFNDDELSLRDLYAIVRGTGYDGGDISPQMSRLNSLFESAAQARLDRQVREEAAAAAFERDVQTIVDNASELDESRSYEVRIKMRKDELGWDWDNELKATYETLTVDGRTYNSWQVGQVISSQSDNIGIITGESGFFDTYDVSVDQKKCTKAYSYRDAQGNNHAVADETVFAAAQKRLLENGKAVEFDSPDFHATYVMPSGFHPEDVVSRAPLKRHFVTLEIRNNSFSLSLTKQLRDDATKHRIEIEIPPDTGDSAVAFDQDINTANYFLTGRLSHMSGKVVSSRTEQDREYELLTLTDGRRIIAKKP